MTAAGPQLPPQLVEKRKRPENEFEEVEGGTPSKITSETKKRRVIGPAPPPAPPAELPELEVNHDSNGIDSSDSSDDDYGPTLPPQNIAEDTKLQSTVDLTKPTEPRQVVNEQKRDDWMLVPPKQDDLAARMDPTKLRARKFNTGRGGKGPGQAETDSSVWTETPEQKRKRLQDAVLGVSKQDISESDNAEDRRRRAEDKEKARRTREYNETHRSKSLYDQHQGSTPKVREDDPSSRAFDYEKDMNSGMKIGHVQKREMLKRAGDFSSKFSSGNFL